MQILYDTLTTLKQLDGEGEREEIAENWEKAIKEKFIPKKRKIFVQPRLLLIFFGGGIQKLFVSL